MSGGNSVFTARGLYHLIDPDADYEDDYDLCNAAGIILNQCPEGNSDKSRKSTLSDYEMELLEENGNFEIFPNPTNNLFTVKTGVEWANGKCLLFNSLGSLVRVFNLNTSFHTVVNVSELPTGVYWLKSENLQGDTKTSRVIISN